MTGTGPTAAEMNRLLATIAPTTENRTCCMLAKESVIFSLPEPTAGPSDGHARKDCSERANSKKRQKSAISRMAFIWSGFLLRQGMVKNPNL